MKILLLTKTKSHYTLDPDNIITSILKSDNFFAGYYRALVKLGHEVSVCPIESIFISSTAKICRPKLSRLIRGILKITGLHYVDKLFMTLFFARITKSQNIDFLFTELNDTFYPKLLKKIMPQLIITQWFGVFPTTVSNTLKRRIKQYDINFTPCMFSSKISEIYFENTDKFIGCSAEVLDEHYGFENQKNKILFYGGITSKHKLRNEFLKSLGEKIDIHGYVEKDMDIYFYERCKGFVDASNLYKTISQYKYAINFGLDGFQDIYKGHNNRLFEIAACGTTLQFVERSDFVKDFFEDDEVIQFGDIEELSILVARFENNEALRLQVCQRALTRSRRYTYDARAQKIIDCVTALSARRGVQAC